MKSIRIRNVDEGTLAALKRLARNHRRSLQAELQVILERAAQTAPPEEPSTEPKWLIVNTGRRDARWSRGATWAVPALLLLQACGTGGATRESAPQGTAASPAAALLAADAGALSIDAGSFGCITELTAVRHFYVGNLLGNLAATVAVAESTDGGVYPPGSVVQLVPTEVMVKHPSGVSPATRDWEFFELEVTAEGTRINTRGFSDVVNRFGGNCLDCHSRAEPRYDLICELDHGCDPIPVTRERVRAIQAADPRCSE